MSALRRLRNFWIPWVAIIVLGCFSEAVAQTSYQVSDLGVLKSTDDLGCAMALNNFGWTLSMSFQTSELPLSPRSINDRGQIVGTVGNADNTTQYAALWQNGALTNLLTLPGDFAAIATGINNRGQIVGSAPWTPASTGPMPSSTRTV